MSTISFRASTGQADRLLRWLITPSLLLYVTWKMFLFSDRWFEARLPAALGFLLGFVFLWAVTSVFVGLDQLRPQALLVAGLASLGPLIRSSIEGISETREAFATHPAITMIDLAFTLFLASVIAPACFYLHRRVTQ